MGGRLRGRRAAWLGLAGALVCFLPAGADVRRRWYVDFELGVPRSEGPPVWPGDEKQEPITETRKEMTLSDFIKDIPIRGFKQEKPALFQYKERLGRVQLCWFVAFTLHNPSDQYVPIQVDLMLHTDQGKDYHQDVVRTDPAIIARGKYYSSVVQPPDLELQIIRMIEKLGNRNEEMQRERVAELKAENRYLNPAELRRKAVLKPDETVTGLAVFRAVDKNSDIIELLVGGLVDVVKLAPVERVDRNRRNYVYENRVLHVRYLMPGDEYGDISDSVSPQVAPRRWWETHQIGLSGDKETLAKLIAALDSEDPAVPPDVRAQLPVVTYGPMVRRGAHEALKKLTGEDFGYDPDTSAAENLGAIRLWREWWTRNSEKLVYNDVLNVFEIKKQDIPGAVDVKPPYAK